MPASFESAFDGSAGANSKVKQCGRCDAEMSLQELYCPQCGFQHEKYPGLTYGVIEIDNDLWTRPGFECCIEGQAPVQGEGYILGHPFYFRSRWDSWYFVMCINSEVDPAGMRWDEPGFFKDGALEGFAQCGDYGETHDASYMPKDVAETIIRNCAIRFLEAVGHPFRLPQS